MIDAEQSRSSSRAAQTRLRVLRRLYKPVENCPTRELAASQDAGQ